MNDKVGNSPAAAGPMPGLPLWAQELISLYESGAANHFILYGNVNDRFVLPLADKPELGSLRDFLLRVLLPKFDVILSFDIGNGIRVEKGGPLFGEWFTTQKLEDLPAQPLPAVEFLTRYFRYCANLTRLKQKSVQIGCLVNDAQLVVPNVPYGFSYDLSAMASLMREWSADLLLTQHALATFLFSENLNDLHPLLANNGRAGLIKIPLPAAEDLISAFDLMTPGYPKALKQFVGNSSRLAGQLLGTTLGSIESLLKVKEHKSEELSDGDLVALKKELVEHDANGLIEFIEPEQNLSDIAGQEKVKEWFRQDIALWKQNDLQAMSMGYLLCGPVGTGKTYLVNCLAGEAGVPVVKLKNFRDKWVGSSEGNLERIFRLLHALGRCFVFVDEADQALGRRDGGSGDSGVSGRLYSMFAEEMSNTRNRGKIIWILASSRPDLIEVDLKRPGRIDVKIPLFPTLTAQESWDLLQMLCKKRGLDLRQEGSESVKKHMPILLTPGAAEALAVKIYRISRTLKKTALEALSQCLADYQNPVPKETMDFQIKLAVQEASDLEFVPLQFREWAQKSLRFLSENTRAAE